MVDNWIDSLHQWLYPPRCLLCGAPGSAGKDLCAGCHAELPDLGPACARCAVPMTPSSGLCGQCLRRPPPFDGAFVPFSYRPPVDGFIQRLKFSGQLRYARLLGTLLAAALTRRAGPWPEVIIPVPLHRGRQRQRGFNQAMELARPVGQQCGLELAPHAVTRARATRAQSELAASERAHNVRGAFRWRQSHVPASVALIDEVMTTGHTLSELARVVRAQGVAHVEVWCVARAEPPGGVTRKWHRPRLSPTRGL